MQVKEGRSWTWMRRSATWCNRPRVSKGKRGAARDAAGQIGEAVEDASARLGASESLGHEARRPEVGAEQALDLEELIASILSEGDNGSLTPGRAETCGQGNTRGEQRHEGRRLRRDRRRPGQGRARDGFVLSRPRGEDMLAPFDSVYKVEGTLVYLRFELNQLHRQGWESLPPDASGSPDASGPPMRRVRPMRSGPA